MRWLDIIVWDQPGGVPYKRATEDMSERSTKEILQRLGEVSEERDALASDDFRGKHRLNLEADELRVELAEQSSDHEELLKEWAKRAARKSTHSADDEAESAELSIVSASEIGGFIS